MTRPRVSSPAPQPLLLRAAGQSCVAWWHAAPVMDVPKAGGVLPRGLVAISPLPLAVVLASSWGEEDMSGYDGQRALAARLAEAGLGTLRFEWPDSGDSSAETGATSVADALAAFQAAADSARALSGCERLAFVGLRLGALLAAHAAQARDDVGMLVGVLPVVSGRAFVREQRMLGAGLRHVEARSDDLSNAPTMLGGFALRAAQERDLSALRWPVAGGAMPVQEALLLSSADTPSRPAADALAQAGVRVSEWAHSDLANALAIAHQAGLADVAVNEIVRWLADRANDAAAHAPAGQALADAAAPIDARTWMRLSAEGVAVRERVCRIEGAPGRADPALVGVVCERGRGASDGAPGAARRGIVLLSSGRERRVGPHRLWVPFARHRAARGDVVLRLDIAGIGDSEARAEPDPHGTPELYDPRCVDDVARALAWLRREHGVGACTVIGLCSGAHHAWRVALAGVDVQQVVAINPLVFHWKRGLSLDPQRHAFGQIAIAADAGRSMLDPARWWKLLSGRANVGVISGALAARARHAVRLRIRELARLLHWHLRDDLAAELAGTCRRGVVVDFVFSARDPGLTLLREEAGRRGVMLVRDSLVKVCEVAHADHTFAGTLGRVGLYARLDTLLNPAHPMTSSSTVDLPRQAATARP